MLPFVFDYLSEVLKIFFEYGKMVLWHNVTIFATKRLR